MTPVLLTPADHGRPMNYADFVRAQGQEGFKYELIEGKIEVSPLPKLSHESLEEWLLEKLLGYKRQHPEIINKVSPKARITVPADTITTAPEPDLAAYHDFPRDQRIGEVEWEDVSPVLVIEVLSKDTADRDLVRNLQFYLQVPSVQEYWILDPLEDPNRPTLTVHRRRGQRWQKPIAVKAGKTYTPAQLLPGFTLVVDPHQ